MFTGLVEEMGTVVKTEERPAGRRLWIAASRVLEDASIGDSLAVSGCCLTAVAVEHPAAGSPGRFAVEVVPETLARTALGTWGPGTRVNLERSLRLDQRLGGHLVQGHVDGVGRVVAAAPEGDGRRITIEVPRELARYVAEKGSVSVDGTSLTVAACDRARFEVALIPHTLAATVAGFYAPGTGVHIEVDLIARYVARLLDESDAFRRNS